MGRSSFPNCNLIELRKSEYLKFHNDDVNTIFNISRFIFDEKYDKITDIYKEKEKKK